MSWEWSHAPEAYENAKKNLSELSFEDLVIIGAEIAATPLDEYGNYETSVTMMDIEEYERELQFLEAFAVKDTLIEDIWTFMKKFRTCDNGGWNAHCCPFGCHTVSFDREEDDE